MLLIGLRPGAVRDGSMGEGSGRRSNLGAIVEQGLEGKVKPEGREGQTFPALMT